MREKSKSVYKITYNDGVANKDANVLAESPDDAVDLVKKKARKIADDKKLKRRDVVVVSSEKVCDVDLW